MQSLNSKTTLLPALGLTVAMLGAGCSGSSDKAPVPAVAAPATAEQRQVGATGVPIDPAQKTVVVVVPPGEAKTREQQLVRLQAESQKTEARLSKLIDSYSSNIDSTKNKAKLSAEMAKDMDAYKHQSLQLFKAQRAKQAQAGETGSGS